MRDIRTFLVVGGVVALVAVGALAASVAGGGRRTRPTARCRSTTSASWRGRGWSSTTRPPRAVTIGSVRLDFSDDGRLTAQTGCNGLRGQVSVDDSVLVAGPLMSTRMACEPPLMEQERWITGMLESRPRLEQSGPYLYLHWGEGEQWWLGLERGPAGTSATVPAS